MGALNDANREARLAAKGPAKKANPMEEWLAQLRTPIEAGASTGDLQKEYNQMRNQIQGSWGAGAESLKGQLGQQGFRTGESGVADSALAGLYAQGGQALSKGATDIYLNEVKNRQDLAALNVQRATGAGGLVAAQEQAEAARRAAGAGAGAARAQLEWEKEKFGQEFPWQKEQQTTQQLFDLMGMMGTSQNQVYAQYANAMGQWGNS